ncbi:MAG: DUF3244 domain-containing protein [Tannerellaceae bacterium]|jgi:hypothetical protein|nr:DUF3244 domain-containing protein [Tannerellaceae bacterium]
MKNYYCFAVLFAFLFSVHVYADGENIPVEGKWEDGRVRSFAPERPVVSINGNVLSVYLADALNNLAIIIADSNGSIVYQDYISSNGSGYIHTIDLNCQPGCYTIMITHSLGCLSGSFSMGGIY